MRPLLIATLCLCAQGQTPTGKPEPMNEAKGMPARPSSAEYQAQAKAGAVTVAADSTNTPRSRKTGPIPPKTTS